MSDTPAKVDWLAVWEAKGKSASPDLRIIDGFDQTNLDADKTGKRIRDQLELRSTDRVLEVGCGAGLLSQYVSGSYVGVDYSMAMLKRHPRRSEGRLVQTEASRLCFSDKAFDKAFAFSVFQYFADAEYARRAFDELIRVTSRTIFVGDLPQNSHEPSHLLFDPVQFPLGRITPGHYTPNRFNVTQRCKSMQIPFSGLT